MSDRFDDPEFQAAMAEMGVVHRPGLAASHLEELRPLLEAEGFDIDAPDDLDAFNDALRRANERHNLELMTPVGHHRALALSTLRDVARAMSTGDNAAVERLLKAIEPEPRDDAPAISHLIGVSFGWLDKWRTDERVRTALSSVRLPKWGSKSARAVAKDALALSANGRAFEAVPAMHKRHSGLDILEGGVLTVAATFLACADHPRDNVRGVAPEMFAGAAADAPVAASSRAAAGAAFHRPDPGERSEAELLHQFSAWAHEASAPGDTDVDDLVGLLHYLLTIAGAAGFDLDNPTHVEHVIDEIMATDDVAEDGPVSPALLEALDAFIHFKLETSRAKLAWTEAHDIVEDVLHAMVGASNPISVAIERSEAIDPEVRRRALAELPIVSAVHTLYEWLDESPKVTSTGAVRRADIQRVAAMIGVRAVGVAKRTEAERQTPDPDVNTAGEEGLSALFERSTDDEPARVRAMSELPALADWWAALAMSRHIVLSSTRVMRGQAAEAWQAESLPPLGPAEALVSCFVAETIADAFGRFAVLRTPVGLSAIADLVRAIDPPDPEYLAEDSPETGIVDDAPRAESGAGNPRSPDEIRAAAAEYWRRITTSSAFGRLEDVGLAEPDGHGGYVVPEPLRGVVAKGIFAAVVSIGDEPFVDDESVDDA